MCIFITIESSFAKHDSDNARRAMIDGTSLDCIVQQVPLTLTKQNMRKYSKTIRLDRVLTPIEYPKA